MLLSALTVIAILLMYLDEDDYVDHDDKDPSLFAAPSRMAGNAAS